MKETSTTYNHNIRTDSNLVYGQAWIVRDAGGHVITSIQIFPVRNERTHYSDMEYRVTNRDGSEAKSYVASDGENVHLVVQELVKEKIVEFLVELAIWEARHPSPRRP